MMVQKIRLIRYLVILVVWFSATSISRSGEPGKKLPESKTIHILTVGNSFSNNACTYLEAIARSVPGCDIVVAKASLGGCSLQRHASLIDTCELKSSAKPYSEKYCLKDLLQMDKYDFITIQQVSNLSWNYDSFQPYADKLYHFIRQYAPQSEIIIHQTWAYAPDCKRLTEMGITRDEMHEGLLKSYQALASHLDLGILPSGSAFYKSKKQVPDLDLWVADRYHANENGCYLAGCVWFGRFLGVSPRKIRFIPDKMEPEMAKFLRKVAEQEVKNKKSDRYEK